MRKVCLSLFAVIFALSLDPRAYAIQAQPVPIPEDQSVSPQINISGVGVGTARYAKSAETSRGKGSLDFSDSALQIGGAQKLFAGGAVGSAAVGFLTTEDSNKGTDSQIFIHQAFVDYQSENYEVLFGRTDNPSAHLVDFPTLRGDDLITLTNPVNPFSNGKNAEEHRYSNVASFTLNQKLKYFESIHAQHLINSANPIADDSINSFGVTFQYLGEPGMENFEHFPSWGFGYERIKMNTRSASGLNQLYTGGVFSLNHSVVNRLELGFQDIYSWGSSLRSFSSVTDSFEADSNAAAASIRYLHVPFGLPAFQISLTTGYKSYTKVGGANSYGTALAGVKRLGHGFDAVAQYQAQWRSSALALVQSQGLKTEQKFEVGFALNFDATLNEHIAPRRSLLNQRHRYLSD